MKYAIKVSVFLILWLLWGSSFSNAPTNLKFQKTITEKARYLGDILLISPDKNHWANIILDSVPKAGDYLEKKQVIDWLIIKKGQFSYSWSGKISTVIQPATQSTGIQLVKLAQKALIAQLTKQNYNNIVVDPKSKPKDSGYLQEDFNVEIPPHYPPAKRVCIHLTHAKTSIPIWFAVKVYKYVWVAKRHIKEQTLLKAADFVFKKRDVAGLNHPPYTTFPVGMLLKKSLNKNQILTQTYLGPIPDVSKNKLVKVKIVNSKIAVTTEAIAQQNGFAGEKIKLQNPNTKRYFTGMVMGRNQVRFCE